MEHTIKAPAKAKNGNTVHLSITGKRVYFKIGGKRIAFLIHPANENDLSHNRELLLTHFNSGQKVKSLTPARLSLSRSYVRYSSRDLAQYTLDQIEERIGVNAMLEKFASVEPINK